MLSSLNTNLKNTLITNEYTTIVVVASTGFLPSMSSIDARIVLSLSAWNSFVTKDLVTAHMHQIHHACINAR